MLRVVDRESGPPTLAMLGDELAWMRAAAQAQRRRARVLARRAVALRDESRRSRRRITGAVFAMVTGPTTPTDLDATTATVLIVDDDEAVRGSVAELVAVSGHRVLESRDGEEALQILRSETVDVMIMDLRMPGGDGVSVLSGLPDRAPTVIVHTAADDSDAEILSRDLRSKVFASLRKPVSPPVLLAAIAEAVAEASAKRSSAGAFSDPAARRAAGDHDVVEGRVRSGNRCFGRLVCACGWHTVVGPFTDEVMLDRAISAAHTRHFSP